MRIFIQGWIRLEFVKEYLLKTDLSEENWTRLPFKDDMLIHVKKAFSQEDRAGVKAVVLHSCGLICTHIQDIAGKERFAFFFFFLRCVYGKKCTSLGFVEHIVSQLHLSGT